MWCMEFGIWSVAATLRFGIEIGKVSVYTIVSHADESMFT